MKVSGCLLKPFYPKKAFGQNFLINKGAIEKIVSIVAHYGPTHVLEIGPGRGELTIPISFKVPKVSAIEIDRELFTILEKRLKESNISNVTLIQGDILKQDLSQILKEKTLVLGSLPYHLATLIIERLEAERHKISKAIFILQREVAERICSPPQSKSYGSLSVLVQYNAKTRPLMSLSKGSFWPRPKVDSTLIEMDYQAPYPIRAEREDLFKMVVKGLFLHRRKKILNSLRYILKLDLETLKLLLNRSEISPDSRPEDLPLEAFVRLSNELTTIGGSQPT